MKIYTYAVVVGLIVAVMHREDASLSGIVHVQAQPHAAAELSGRTHSIGIGFGSLSNTSRDQLAAPMRYSGQGLPLSLWYEAQQGRNTHRVEVRYSTTGFLGGELERSAAQATSRRADYYLGELSYAFQRRVWGGDNRPLELFITPSWNTLGHIREYFFSTEETEVTWEFMSSLRIGGGGRYMWGRHEVESSLHVPLFSYVNRPPYAVEGDDVFAALVKRSRFLKLGRIVSINALRAFSYSLAYNYDISSRVRLRVGYDFVYYQYNEPQKTASVLTEFQWLAIIKL